MKWRSPIGEVGGVVKPQIDARLRSETRKYALSVTLVTQFLDALSNDTRAALLGNAKALVTSAWPAVGMIIAVGAHLTRRVHDDHGRGRGGARYRTGVRLGRHLDSD